ncbi:MAG: DUF6048 family protein [Flammeovirgaceae bacterium]
MRFTEFKSIYFSIVARPFTFAGKGKYSYPSSSTLFPVKIKLVSLLILLGLSSMAMAQEEEPRADEVTSDSTKVKPKKDKIKVPFRPKLRGIKLGTDLYPIAFTIFEKDFTGYELNSEFVFDNKFFINADFGSQNAERQDDEQTFVYTNKGTYWRLGLDYNFMHKTFDEEALFVGMRFGNASFDHKANYTSTTDAWGDQATEVSLPNQTASWLELNLGMKVKAIGNFHLSAILRGKFLLSSPSEELLSVVEMPGFGINRNTVTGSIGYRVSYMIPVQKGQRIKKSPKLKKNKGEKNLEKKLTPTDEEE